MMDLPSLLRLIAGLQEAELRRWIVLEWVRPSGPLDAPLFQDVDVARVRLILEMKRDMALDDEAMPVVLSLLDQLYRERARLRRLRDALGRGAPPDIIERVLAVFGEE